jgi:predicted molibdopterin-dependent oxidoreductase YjgC
MLKKLGLLPLSTTLDTALENLDGATVKNGGLCEMMGLIQKLGAMCEKQQEVIHQMTDQIIAGESRTQQHPVVDPEVEEKLREVHRQLTVVQVRDCLRRSSQFLRDIVSMRYFELTAAHFLCLLFIE